MEKLLKRPKFAQRFHSLYNSRWDPLTLYYVPIFLWPRAFIISWASMTSLTLISRSSKSVDLQSYGHRLQDNNWSYDFQNQKLLIRWIPMIWKLKNSMPIQNRSSVRPNSLSQTQDLLLLTILPTLQSRNCLPEYTMKLCNCLFYVFSSFPHFS